MNRKAYTEVYTVLKHIKIEDYKKIPQNVITFLKRNMDENYIYDFDNKNINISREASGILISIYMKYICNNNEKRLMKEILNLNKKLNKK